MKKTVLYPIRVPSGKFCWEYSGDSGICQFFDNEGGVATCELKFNNDQTEHADGVLKAPECACLCEKV